jgi:quercetin dioxygenase-like cupin family protein
MVMRKLKWLMFAGLLVACVCGGWMSKSVLATPGKGITSTIIVGPVPLGEGKVKSESEVNEVEFEAKGVSHLYVVHNRLVPGGHTGWHSHPGISFVMVRAGTLSEYHDDDPDGEPTIYPAGTCLVEPAGRVHLLANEGDNDLELVAFQILPFGATRRVDEDAP